MSELAFLMLITVACVAGFIFGYSIRRPPKVIVELPPCQPEPPKFTSHTPQNNSTEQDDVRPCWERQSEDVDNPDDVRPYWERQASSNNQF